MDGTRCLSAVPLALVLACGGAAGAGPEAPRAHAAEAKAAPATEAPGAPGAAATRDRGWPYGPAPSPDERSALFERLARDPGPIKSNWVPPGKTERYGHAEALIDAPPDAVRAKLVDFGRYKELAGPKFKSVRVVDKQGDSTDVYFQLPIMKGIVTLWYVTRFPPSQSAHAGDVIEGTYVKGNIKDMHIAFTIRPGPDPSTTVLLCDLTLRPAVPAPQFALDEELRDACGDAVRSLRKTLATHP